MSLNILKEQLDSLSESWDDYNTGERSKALEFLQECIKDLEHKSSLPHSEDHYEGNAYEDSKKGMSETSACKAMDCTPVEVCSEAQTTSVTTVDVEESEYSQHTDEEFEVQSEEERKTVLKCPKCEEDFNSKSSLLEHLQSYSGIIKSCVDCHQGFQNSMSFKFHKKLSMCGKANKVFKCKLCSKTLYGSSQFSAHLGAHKRNQCQTCGSHFAKKKDLETHSLSVHNISLNKDLYRCHLCVRRFAQRRSLVYHYKISHPNSCHICPVCLKMFDSSSDAEVHEATHKRQIFTCHKCSEQFSKKQRYLTHMNEHDKYRCEDCKEGFSSKTAAEKHALLGHLVEGLDQLQCAKCGQMFCSRKLLRNHMATRHSGNPFACDKCKITFKHERNYLNHLETNEHLNDKEPKNILACSECGKTFINKNNLRAHVSRMHNVNLTEHCCTLCPYRTTVSTNLKRHMMLHTEKPQFICDKCAAKFQTKSALQEHNLLIHSDRKEFSCDKCGNQFRRRSDLNRHLLNTHSETAQYRCHCGNSYRTLSSLKRHKFTAHNIVDSKQNRLQKLFPVETVEPIKKKNKKTKVKENPKSSSGTTNLQLLHPGIPSVAASSAESNTVVLMTERHPEELLQVSYNMDFPAQIMEDKSQVAYTQSLDMSSFQVVESMIQLDRDLEKQGGNVLINVRNLFGKPVPNNYIIDNQIEPSMVTNLEGSLTNIAVADHKQDLISLQDYIIPPDLSFLNV